jgi:hypothetical protein
MRIMISLTKWYGELIPTKTLIAWAKQNVPRGPWMVSRFVVVGQSPLPERARALLLAFPDDGEVKNQLVANLMTGASVGPISNRVSTDLMTVKGWAQDPSPKIRLWARKLIKGIEARLKQHQMIEEEQEM